jgi:hypothetical protein
MLKTHSESGKLQSASEVESDTTASSILHHLFSYLPGSDLGSPSALCTLYVIVVTLTLLPLLIGASLGTNSIINPNDHGHFHLPFLYDFSNLFAFLVSFPCLIILTVTDQHVLTRSLKIVQVEGTITISENDKLELRTLWNKRFRIANLIGQASGIIVGTLVTYINYYIYRDPNYRHWMINDAGALLGVGYINLYCFFLFYAFIPLYVSRNITISLLLWDITARAQVHLLPLHPDKCGGLRPVGRLGLRNQYALTLFGLNLALLWWVTFQYLIGPADKVSAAQVGLITGAVIAYMILGPIVFMAPLLPFRRSMQVHKGELLSEVILRLRAELDRLRERFPSGAISKDDEELIERLSKICGVIDEVPVWPFDPSTLRKFLTAYVIPIFIPIISAGYSALNTIFTLTHRTRGRSLEGPGLSFYHEVSTGGFVHFGSAPSIDVSSVCSIEVVARQTLGICGYVVQNSFYICFISVLSGSTSVIVQNSAAI